MKKTLSLLFILALGAVLTGCGETPSVSSSAVPSISESQSSQSESVASSSSSSSSAISSDGEDFYYQALIQEHSYPTVSYFSNIKLGTERLGYVNSKSEVDVTNKIEHITSYSETIQSIDGANSSTSVVSSEVFKSQTDTYTKLDSGLYNVTSGSDGHFELYVCQFDFTKLENREYSYESFRGIISGTVSDPSGFMGSAVSEVTSLTVKTYANSNGELTSVELSYVKSEIYSVSVTYSFEYLPNNLVLPA